ncbi:hypothetical protein YC2023_093167 [Brassica napus]
MENERGKLIYLATLAYLAKRYDDMTKSMRKVCEYEIELTDVERELLAIGYKNVMTTKRASLRALSSIGEKEDSKGNKQNVKLINKKLEIVKHEFSVFVMTFCLSLILISFHQLPMLSQPFITTQCELHPIIIINIIIVTVIVFSCLLCFLVCRKANYFRYMAEFGSDAERQGAADNSLEAYKIAMEMAEGGLSPTNLVRLGLALNFSIFNYVILKSTESACKQGRSQTLSSLGAK